MGEHCPCKVLGAVALLHPQPTLASPRPCAALDATAPGYSSEVPKQVLLALPRSPLPATMQLESKIGI